MSSILREMREYAYQFYSSQPLKYHVNKFLVYSGAQMSKYIPSKVQISVVNSSFGSPLRRLLYENFCGGKNITEAVETANTYSSKNISSILDYVSEGESNSSNSFDLNSIDSALPFIERTPENTMLSLKLSGIFGIECLKTLSQSIKIEKVEPERMLNGIDREKYVYLLSRLSEIRAKKMYSIAVDAEWSDIQPAITFLAFELMKKLNIEGPFVHNTYQAYLKDATDLYTADIKQSISDGFHLGAKIVRGAYLRYEKSKDSNLVWDNIFETHASYDKCIRLSIELLKERKPSVILATHNELSICKALEASTANDSIFSYAQLHGMRDFLTFFLANRSEVVYKYIPYGDEAESIPYLIRRVDENSGAFDSLQFERKIIQKELFRRIFLNRQ